MCCATKYWKGITFRFIWTKARALVMASSEALHCENEWPQRSTQTSSRWFHLIYNLLLRALCSACCICRPRRRQQESTSCTGLRHLERTLHHHSTLLHDLQPAAHPAHVPLQHLQLLHRAARPPLPLAWHLHWSGRPLAWQLHWPGRPLGPASLLQSCCCNNTPVVWLV